MVFCLEYMVNMTLQPECLHEQQKATQAIFQEIFQRNLRYYIESYGCQMNGHDSEKLAGMLQEMGFSPANQKENADIILFNTCCVREHAEKRVFGNVGALKKRKDEHPGLIIGVCGCMMQQAGVGERLLKRYPFVNFVMGTHMIHTLPTIVQRVFAGERPLVIQESGQEIIEGLPIARVPGVSASVNIMYGCNNFCSYCIVPYVRGRERSRDAAHILEEIKGLCAQGYSEIMLLGQNVNSYGKDTGAMSFSKLLREVQNVEGLRRIRFMTSHPKDLSDELIAAMAELSNVCKHIHLPVQHGNNRILEQMNRRYTREDYLRLVKKLREAIPEIEITTDFIVGFPGETEEEFLETLSLVEEVGFSAAFTFMYSPRTGTKAATYPNQIAAPVKKERLLRLNALQAEYTRKTNQRYIGQQEEVLVEGCDTRTDVDLLYGKLSCFKMVYFPGSADKIGTYVQVNIQKTQQNSLTGVAVPSCKPQRKE
ncbi:tRNA (N6-isopentenyl adenosine(37)-C2)-methylthiotransferase MiaB [Christensenellaceae bacterium OttesenSCG-928-L17]|nr:tRNA (N6-isopentenyl adenosine(37)-C2)-methylthiotransferase MiaB [Christensenellaceae bacterium OttesenSCG-928-L17]